MRLTGLVVGGALAMSGCGGDSDEGGTPSSDAPASSAAAAPADAVEAVGLFYDAVGRRDCIVLRGLSTLEEQQEDDAWAECIDVMLEVAGDDFSYRVVGDSGSASPITFTVASSSTVGGQVVEREDPLVMVDSGGQWLVDDSVVTAGG
ncbi:hypothetical protein [Nocardioides sp.]|uniref:hypothetical protein n=1 Tax=Nocardioides sp. TaxID=35761 RepID=UPI00271E87B3|nr:hypothetical protein [Nocardioides sp.]MDO9457514.1 hypothetical protein [Nocardioides sp.]